MTRINNILIAIVLGVISSFLVAGQAHSNEPQISPEQIKQVTNNLVHALNKVYLYPEKTRDIAQSLLLKTHTEQYKSAYDLNSFRGELRDSLIKATNDSAFDVTDDFYLNQPIKLGISTEVSDENIGYLKLEGDLKHQELEQTLNGALEALQDVKALIIDLRKADSVDLDVAINMLSHFVPAGSKVGNLKTNSKTEAIVTTNTKWTKIYSKQLPLYILHSAFIAGEWELFSYALQQAERAKIVGEYSMGVAEFNDSIVIGEAISVTLPYATFEDFVSEENWQQEGITPDVHERGDDALKVAYGLAKKEVNKAN